MRRLRAVVALAILALGVWGFNAALAPGRFPLEEIRLQGRINTRETDIQESLRAMGVTQGVNLLRVNPWAVRERLNALPWVRNVRVERVFPGTLALHLVEKAAVCVGRDGERLVLLDEYGAPFKRLESDDPLRLPVVSRNGGAIEPEAAVGIMNLLGEHPWLRDRLSEAVGLPGGRWMMFSREGVKLIFSQRIRAEMSLLRRLQDQYRILDRRVRQVDMRVAGQAAVRPLPEQQL